MTKMNQRLLTISMKKSENASAFISYLRQQQIPIYKLRIYEKNVQFSVAFFHLHTIRKARRQFRVKLTIHYTTPNRILQKDMMTFLGVFLLLCIPLLLSQFVWKIEIQAETIELEDSISEYLVEKQEIRLPMLRKQFIQDDVLRQQLMEQYRTFSWVHITKKGGLITISPQIAPEIKELDATSKEQHLIASNSGVITHFDLESGVRQVEPNDTVYKGDTLVSGVMMKGDEYVMIGASGEVYADYWLETNFSIPKTVKMDVLVDYGWVYNMNWQQLKAVWVQQSLQPLTTFISYSPYRKFEEKTELIDENNMDLFILPLLHEKMIQSLPLKSTIKTEKLLHVLTDDDTVKGKVLYLVNENIAKPHPIYQGE